MRSLSLSATLLSAALALTPAASANDDIGRILGGVANSILNQEMDKAAYIQAQNTNTAAAYRNYLSRYPNGVYRAQAQQALNRLDPRSTSANRGQTSANSALAAARTEAALNLTRQQRTNVQAQLNRLGYNTGTPDGLWGSRTRSAIQNWQKAQRLNQTGYVTAAQLRQINEQARGRGTTTPQPAASNRAQIEEQLLSLSASERREIQLRLSLLGFDTRGTDGVFGRNTRSAISRWQAARKLGVTGYLNADQVRRLRSKSRG